MPNELALAAAAPEPLTGGQRVAFLTYIREHPDCSVREAADHVGVKRKQIRHLKATDEQFAGDYRDARGYGDDTIRAEVKRRAIEGVVEPVFGSLGGDAGTGIVGTRIVYSDRLLGMMAKAYLSEYRDKVEVSGPQGGSVPVEVNGGRVTGISDVFELARQLGVGLGEGLRGGLQPGAARDALPAPSDVLSDPSDG